MLLVPAGVLLGVGLSGVALWSTMQSGPPPSPGDTPTPASTVVGDQDRQRLTRLLSGLDRFEARGSASQEDLAQLRELRAQLLGSSLSQLAQGELARAGERLALLEESVPSVSPAPTRSPPQGRVDPPAGTGEPDLQRRVARQRDGLVASCARTVRLALEQRGSPLARGAEESLGAGLRARLRSALEAATGEGPEAIIALATDPAWHGLVGPGGYAQLLELSGTYSRDLSDDPLWKALVERGRATAQLALSYAWALQEAEAACQRGDRDAALAILSDAAHADDRWFRASLRYLERPDVVVLIERLTPAREPGAEDPTDGAPAEPAAQLSLGWREQLALALEEWERQTSSQRLESIQPLLVQALAEAQTREAEAVVLALTPVRKRLVDEPELAAALREIEELHAERAFARASGPATFNSLAEWCRRHDLESWEERLSPFLSPLPERDPRERARRARSEAFLGVAAFQVKRLEQLAAELSDLLNWMRSERFASEEAKSELAGLIERALRRCGADFEAARLVQQLGDLEHDPSDARKLARAFERRLDKARQRVRKSSLTAVDRCLAAGEAGLAFDLFAYALLLDPDDERARKALGQARAKGQWLRRYDAKRLGEGFEWDPARAWVRSDQRDRYGPDRHLDLQEGAWVSLGEANQRHAQVDDPWIIETEHFELRSTAPLDRTARVARRLEDFYLAIFRLYEPFFSGGSKVVFGVAPAIQERLTVWDDRDEDQYLAHADPPPGAAGFHDSERGGSFFYDDGQDGFTVLQHEVTHHILAAASAHEQGDRHRWLVEAAAVFLEVAGRGPDDVLSAGSIEDNYWVRTYAKALETGDALTPSEIVGLQNSAQWDAAKPRGYVGAGGLIYFLCHMDNGCYRADVIDMIRDAYNGKAVKLETYTGLTPEALGVYMRHFYAHR